MDDITAWIAGLPKAELHVHLVGSADLVTVLELARRHPQRGVPTDEEALRDFYTFRDFDHFIEVYIAVNSLVRSAEDVQALTEGVARHLAGQQVRYAELTVTPDTNLLEGIPGDELGLALAAAATTAESYGLELAYTYDVAGELGLASGERTVDWIERYAPPRSTGFGLGGPEVGVPRPAWAPVFDRARALGLHSVPHAGETTGPQTIVDALDHLHAERIGHGIAAARSPELMARLAADGIPLEVCPTSNLCTSAVAAIDEHPFPLLRDAGVVVTLNSDDPGMFSTTLNQEYALAHREFGLDRSELADLVRTALEVSYAPPHVRAAISSELDDYLADTGVNSS